MLKLKSTEQLITRLNEIRSRFGPSWRRGWIGNTHSEADTIIAELLSRSASSVARKALKAHGIT